MDKEKLLKEMEAKKRELEELERKLSEMEEPEQFEINKEELLKEISRFPRYYINMHGEIYHEAGIRIKEIEAGKVELFDSKNNKVLVKIDDLINENF